MNQDLCVSPGQEGPSVSDVAQEVKSNLGYRFDVLTKELLSPDQSGVSVKQEQ